MLHSRLVLAFLAFAAFVTAAALLSTWPTDTPQVRALSAATTFVVVVGAALLIRRYWSYASEPRMPGVARVEHDGDGLRLWPSDGPPTLIAWAEIQGIDVLTTSDGPWAEDVFILLRGPGEQVHAIPQGSDGFPALVERLISLPGFSVQEFTRAMGSTSDQRFVCWRRPERPVA